MGDSRDNKPLTSGFSMSGPHSSGKGDRPRPYSVSTDEFASNWDAINWSHKHRLIQGDGKHRNRWFVIRADEAKTFCKWLSAENDRGHYPANFTPTEVKGPGSIVFTDWREATGRTCDGCNCN